MRKQPQPKPCTSDLLIGAGEIAAHLGVSIPTVWRWLAKDDSFARRVRVRRIIKDSRLGNRRLIESTRKELDSWRDEKPTVREVCTRRREVATS